jgi:hypothetical protein
MSVLVVIPKEKVSAKVPGIFNRAKLSGKPGRYFSQRDGFPRVLKADSE